MDEIELIAPKDNTSASDLLNVIMSGGIPKPTYKDEDTIENNLNLIHQIDEMLSDKIDELSGRDLISYRDQLWRHIDVIKNRNRIFDPSTHIPMNVVINVQNNSF